MKKFISALTAFCMCASMTAASLPASALTMTDSSAITAFAGDCTWTVSNEVFDPAKDEYVTLHVTVTGDTAAYGFEFTPYFDGKDFAAAGFELWDIAPADTGYTDFETFTFNPDNGHVGSAKKTEGNQTIADGSVVVDIDVVPPANAKPGQVYKVSLNNLIVGDSDQNKYKPASVDGSITIAGGSDTPSDTPSETPTQAPSQTPSQTPSDVTPDRPSAEDKKNASEWTWYFDDTTYNPKTGKDGKGNKGYIEITAYVTKDQGTYGFDFTPLIDGKTFAEQGFEIDTIEWAADGGYPFETFATNVDNGHVGGSSKLESNTVLADGTAVVTFTVLPPENLTEGKTYEITFKDLTVGDDNNVKHTPATIAGTLTIVGDEEPSEDPTEAPTQAPT